MALRSTALRLQRQFHLQRAVQSSWILSSNGNSKRSFATKKPDAVVVDHPMEEEHEKHELISAMVNLLDDASLESVSTATLAELNTKEHVNKWFPFSKATQKQFFAEKLNKRVDETFDLLHYRHIMMRYQTMKILNKMQNWEENKDSSDACLINGERGSGKSFALLQIVQFARENGWIVMYVPRARSWVNDAPYVIPSPYIEGKFDIDVVGMELLKNLLHVHKEQLGQIKVRGNYGDRYWPAKLGAKPKDPKSFDPSTLTLLDLVENGLRDEELACAAVWDLRQELAQVTEFPVMIAVDEYNLWFRDTVFAYEGVDVKPTDISLIAALRSVDLNGKLADESTRLQNGMFVVATSENYPSKYKTPRADKEFNMKPYNQKELESVGKYYEETKLLWVLGKNKIGPKELAYVRIMTKGLPLHVLDLASTS